MHKTPIIMIVGPASSGKDTVADLICKHSNTGKIALADPFKHYLRYLFDLDLDLIMGPSENRSVLDERTMGGDFWDSAISKLSQERGYTETWLVEMGFLGERVQTAFHYLFNWVCNMKTQYVGVGCSIRTLLQSFGTEWGRVQNPNLWIDAGLRRAQEYLCNEPYCDFVVISDGRRRNEVLKTKMVGGLIIKLETNRPKEPEKFREHISETDLETIPEYWYDVVVFNDQLDKKGLEKLETRIKSIMEGFSGF